jgi:hypothetical protein
MTISEFNDNIEKHLITYQSEAKLIPILTNQKDKTYEIVLTSIFLRSLCLVKEFRELIFKEIGLKNSKTCKIHVYLEVGFLKPGNKDVDILGKENNRIDGMLLIERGSKIVDSAFFEMKNKSNKVDSLQIEKYRNIALEVGVTKLVTVSNEYVTNSSQLPYQISTKKSTSSVNLFHLSWSSIISKARVLLYKNDINIEDQDQVNIMNEVVDFFENPKSGVSEYSEMCTDWPKFMDSIGHFNSTDDNSKIFNNVTSSWLQEEKDLAIKLTSNLHVFVQIKTKTKDISFSERINNLTDILSKNDLLISEFIIPGIVSNLKIIVDCKCQNIKLSISVKDEKAQRSIEKLNYIQQQLLKCRKKDVKNFDAICDLLGLEIAFKNLKNGGLINRQLKGFIVKNQGDVENYINKDIFDMLKTDSKDKDIKTINVYMEKSFRKDVFKSRKKFVQEYEKMVTDFCENIVIILENRGPGKLTFEANKKNVDFAEDNN